jgi:hypothetical protein
VDSKQGQNDVRRRVPVTNPDHLWGCSKQEAPLAKIRIFGDDDKGVFGRVSPDGLVVRSCQPNVANVRRPGVEDPWGRYSP